MGSGQGWRGCAGRGSNRWLGRSGQQRGGGLAGAHWSMLNRGADEAGSRKTTGQGDPSAWGGGVGAAEAGWAEGTISTANRAGSSRRHVPRLRERAPPPPPPHQTPREKGSDHKEDQLHQNYSQAW